MPRLYVQGEFDNFSHGLVLISWGSSKYLAAGSPGARGCLGPLLIA